MSPEPRTNPSSILKNMRLLLTEMERHVAPDSGVRAGLLKYGILPSSLDDLRVGCRVCCDRLTQGFEPFQEDRATIVRLKRTMDSGITALRFHMDGLLASLQRQMTAQGSVIDRWKTDREASLICGDYLMFARYHRQLKLLVYRWLVRDYNPSREIVVDENSPLFDSRGMDHVEFPSDMKRLREWAAAICLHAPKLDAEEKQVLEQQIMEILKNAVRHGNARDLRKKVRAWFRFSEDACRIIVEDEGKGFRKIEEWNAFFRERNAAMAGNDMEKVFQYMAFTHGDSEENDGGNALFAAVEFWDSGLVFNEKRNKVAAMKYCF